MQSIVISWIATSLFCGASVVWAQSATLGGEVVLPVGVGEKKRSFRGSLYRNRQTPSARVKSLQKDGISPYQAIIISAHPTSFDPEVKPLSVPVEIEQVGVAFAPRVTPITVGSTVEFINNDAIYHNVFSLTPGAKFNVGRHPTGKVVAQKIAKSGVIDLFCDIHPQMHGAILSLDTPYFAGVDKEGKYLLDDLPAGTYQVRAFYPGLDLATVELEFEAGEAKTWHFRLSR